jgi:hypothetical protein
MKAENVEAAQKMLENCCGRGPKPDLDKLASLLGLPAPPQTFLYTKEMLIMPRSGMRAFSLWAMEKLGFQPPYAPTDAPHVLSNLLDTLRIER